MDLLGDRRRDRGVIDPTRSAVVTWRDAAVVCRFHVETTAWQAATAAATVLGARLGDRWTFAQNDGDGIRIVIPYDDRIRDTIPEGVLVVLDLVGVGGVV